MKLSVIVPAYNEEGKLKESIKKFHGYLTSLNYDFEIIIVNDGSNDKTSQIAWQLATELKNTKIIDNKTNKGKGSAVRQGLLAGQGQYRLFIDADNATSIDHIEKTWPLFDQGCEIVIGTRNKRDAQGACQAKPQKIWKRLFGILGNKLIQLVTLENIWDTQCGFKILTDKAVAAILPLTKIDRWAFDVEILILARRLKIKIGLIPVVWFDCSISRVKIRDYLYFLKDLALIRFRLLAGRYKT